jgi:hypothetical protein
MVGWVKKAGYGIGGATPTSAVVAECAGLGGVTGNLEAVCFLHHRHVGRQGHIGGAGKGLRYMGASEQRTDKYPVRGGAIVSTRQDGRIAIQETGATVANDRTCNADFHVVPDSAGGDGTAAKRRNRANWASRGILASRR